MNQRHHVYTTEEEILSAIDRAMDRLKRHRDRCVELEAMQQKCVRKLAKAKGTSKVGQLRFEFSEHEKELLRLCKIVRGIEDTTLPKLKRALAAFRTKTFPFMGDYQGVVAA